MFSSLWRIIGGYLKPHYYESDQNGFRVIVCVGREELNSKELFTLFRSRITEVWPRLFSTMKSGFEDYGHSKEFPPAFFFMNVSRMDPDAYMGDKSSFHVSFEFEREKFCDALPIYDFFLDEDLETVHHQPVF